MSWAYSVWEILYAHYHMTGFSFERLERNMVRLWFQAREVDIAESFRFECVWLNTIYMKLINEGIRWIYIESVGAN